jgi:hypothetical protein
VTFVEAHGCAPLQISLLLFIGILLVNQATAQLPLKPFTGKPAPTAVYFDRFGSLVDGDRDRLVTIFKDIHQNPELRFMATRTAAIVAKQLKVLDRHPK